MSLKLAKRCTKHTHTHTSVHFSCQYYKSRDAKRIFLLHLKIIYWDNRWNTQQKNSYYILIFRYQVPC